MRLFLSKYLVLLAALSVSIYVLLVKYSFTNKALMLVCGLSVAYIVLHVLEFIVKQKKQVHPEGSFLYYSHGLITKKVIRIGVLIITGGILILSGTKVLLFGIVLGAMLVAEIISLILEFKNNNYFLFFEEKAITISYEERKLFASHIQEIEFRYDIFYFTLKNNQVKLIELDKLEENQRQKFTESLINWAVKQSVPFSKEAIEKLGIK